MNYLTLTLDIDTEPRVVEVGYEVVNGRPVVRSYKLNGDDAEHLLTFGQLQSIEAACAERK